MNGTLLLAPDLLAAMRAAAHKAIALDEAVVTTRCIVLALLDDDDFGDTEVFRGMLERTAAVEEGQCEPTVAFKTPDGAATMRLSDGAYRVFMDGAQQAAGRYTKADLVAALTARASQTI